MTIESIYTAQRHEHAVCISGDRLGDTGKAVFGDPSSDSRDYNNLSVGIIGLREGLRFVMDRTPAAILSHEQRLCDRLISRVSSYPKIKTYRTDARYVPIVAFNVGDINSHIISSALSEKGFALRGGLHCAALAHNSLGTLTQGAVRFSPSVFNTMGQVDMLADTLLSM